MIRIRAISVAPSGGISVFYHQHEAHAMVQLTGGSHFSALDHTISVGQGLYGHAQLDCMPIDPRARLVHDLQNSENRSSRSVVLG